jgi:hypothetical protein
MNNLEQHPQSCITDVSGSAFQNGDKVKYAYGLTFIFVGLDPFDNNYAYCVNIDTVYQTQPELKHKIVDRLPLERLTHYR